MCRGKFKSERDDSDLEEGNNDVLVLGFEPATINFVEPKKKVRQRTRLTFGSRVARSLAKSGGISLLQSVSAVSTTDNRSAALSSSSITSTKENSTSKKAVGEKAVQLLVKGVWVLKKLAMNVCEVTYVNRLEDKGDILVDLVNMGVVR